MLELFVQNEKKNKKTVAVNLEIVFCISKHTETQTINCTYH